MKKFYLILFVISMIASCADCDNFMYFILWHVACALLMAFSGYKLVMMEEGD